MPKKKEEVEEKPMEYMGPLTMPEIPVEKPIIQASPTDMIMVKVKVGTLLWEGGSFEKDSTFTVSRQRLKLFDQKDIEVLS
jgi:hypothetical protein